MSRHARSLAAILALVTLVFAQVAIAVYDCAPIADVVAVGDCCDEGGDPAEPALCRAHCQQGNQSLDKPSASLPVHALAPMTISFPGAARVGLTASFGELPSLLARATAPPLALRHCCLRI